MYVLGISMELRMHVMHVTHVIYHVGIWRVTSFFGTLVDFGGVFGHFLGTLDAFFL